MKRATMVLLALAISACSKDSAKPQGSTEAPQASAAPVPDPFLSARPPASSSASADLAPPAPKSSVTLQDPGREPRRELRYAWREDDKEQMAITLRTTVSAESGGARQDVPFPALHIALAIDAKSVSADGDLRYAWRVTSAQADADAGAPQQVAEGWAAQLAPIAHLSGTGAFTSRGLSAGVSLDPPTAGDAGMEGEMVVQVLQMLRDACAPLPEEPVGTGAKWQKVST
ncbi:MAG: hypothetical protein WBR29_07745, partial [Gammaproteobacteria bacterium]